MIKTILIPVCGLMYSLLVQTGVTYIVATLEIPTRASRKHNKLLSEVKLCSKSKCFGEPSETASINDSDSPKLQFHKNLKHLVLLNKKLVLCDEPQWSVKTIVDPLTLGFCEDSRPYLFSVKAVGRRSSWIICITLSGCIEQCWKMYPLPTRLNYLEAV